MKHNDFEVIFETKAGSHLYGTNTPLSDLDFRGVCVTSIRQMLDPFQSFEQQIETKETDRVIFDIKKYFELFAQNNPNIVELAFSCEPFLVTLTEKGKMILDNRQLFLSQEIRKTFSGYALSQLKRIKLHRGYLLNPPSHKPTREEYGLKDSPDFGLEKIINVINAPIETIKEEWRDIANKERSYRSSSENYQKYEQWVKGRNPKRAELEAKFGYDLKHSNHLVRLLLEGEELLTTGDLKFPLTYREQLLEILSGKYSYDELMEMVEKRFSEFDNIKSNLPMKPDLEKLKEIYYNILGI